MVKFIYTLLCFRSLNCKIVFAILFILLFTKNIFALGSLITIRNTYFYTTNDFQSERYYITAYNVFKVVDLKSSLEGKRYFFMVENNIIKKNLEGSGFIYADLENNKDIQLFLEIPQNKEDLLDYYLINPYSLVKTTQTFQTDIFPFLNWQEVTFKLDLPERVWALDSSVIYRPNKSKKWLKELSLKLLRDKSISKNKRMKILKGIVELGYVSKEVILSLGEPLERKLNNDSLELNYDNQKIILKKDKVTQIINL